MGNARSPAFGRRAFRTRRSTHGILQCRNGRSCISQKDLLGWQTHRCRFSCSFLLERDEIRGSILSSVACVYMPLDRVLSQDQCSRFRVKGRLLLRNLYFRVSSAAVVLFSRPWDGSLDECGLYLPNRRCSRGDLFLVYRTTLASIQAHALGESTVSFRREGSSIDPLSG